MGASNPYLIKAHWVWGVSALALVAVTGESEQAKADLPSGLTIQLQGLDDLDHSGKTQPFKQGNQFAQAAAHPADNGSGFPDPSIHPGTGGEFAAKVTYQPQGSPMSYALGVKYGSTKTISKSFHHTYVYPAPFSSYYNGSHNEKSSQHQDHTIIDFEVGKDVGVGVFGTGVTTIGGGLRYAHFESKTESNFNFVSYYYPNGFHYGTGKASMVRKSDSVGPRVFIKQTSPFPGRLGDAGVALSWGAGAAVLFGRQTTTNTVHLSSGTVGLFTRFSRNKTMTMGSVDGYMQLDWNPNKSPFVVSGGYKMDLFVNAMDGGFSFPHEVNIIEQGPFLSLSWKLK